MIFCTLAVLAGPATRSGWSSAGHASQGAGPDSKPLAGGGGRIDAPQGNGELRRAGRRRQGHRALALRGGRGSDTLRGGRGDDRLYGGAGRDVLVGGAGDDRMYGAAGADRLLGQSGADTLLGGAGDDRLDGGPGADYLDGGAGRDRIAARRGGPDRIDCGAGRDVVYVDADDRVIGCEHVVGIPRDEDTLPNEDGYGDGDDLGEDGGDGSPVPDAPADFADEPPPGGDGDHLFARPNIVLILTDDQRSDTVTSEYMPNVGSLLAQPGLTFTNAFVTRALCCPSRASILTGQYAHNHGVFGNYGASGGFSAFDDTATLATWLQDAGYRTGLVGKYLNYYGAATGYQGVPAGPTYLPAGWDRFVAFTLGGLPGGGYYGYTLNIDGQQLVYHGGETGDYSTNVIADYALDFIDTAEQDDDRPFYLHFAPFAPHSPYTPAPGDESAFTDGEGRDIVLPHAPSFNEADVSDKPTWVRNLNGGSQLRRDQVAGLNRNRVNQLRMSLAVDQAVGAIVDELERLDELDNTLIVYTSDNGFLWGEHRAQAKSNTYEESARVPLVVRGPGVQPGTIDLLAANIDLAPTFAELAQVPATETTGVDGRSLAPVLRGQPADWRNDLLIEHWQADGGGIPSFKALRTPRYKYVEYKTDPVERELYDLEADPFEEESLIRGSEPVPAEYAELQSLLSARMNELATCVGAGCRAGSG